MKAEKHVLLVLTSVALFAAAPILAQEMRPPAEYALGIDGTMDGLIVSRGIPKTPVALLLGVKEIAVMLPGDALLRVEPLFILHLGRLDIHGECHVTLGPEPREPVPHFDIFSQAISAAENWTKICVSELFWIHTDLAHVWEFEHRG